jgi:DNA-binding IclR family transcriptional regulator
MWRSRPHRSCARGPRGQGQPVRPCPRWKRLGLTRIGSVSPETGDACPSRKAGDLLNTIDRTGKVLNLFTAETPEWGVTEVATTLELPTSTTFDIVASLAEIGLLQQTSDDRYRLGWRVLVISRRLMTSTCFNAQTRNIVAEVANQLGAVVTLGAWDGQGVVCIANASGNRTERVLADEVHISRHASALGKLLMAQLPWPKVQERIDRYRLPALTENSVSDINILRAQQYPSCAAHLSATPRHCHRTR